MNDQELRALVRDAVARHLWACARAVGACAGARSPQAAPAPHPSHAIYLIVVNADDACVIEPSVPCNHCGYCKSHGH